MSETPRIFKLFAAMMIVGGVLIMIGLSGGVLPDITIPTIVWDWWDAALWCGMILFFIPAIIFILIIEDMTWELLLQAGRGRQ